MNKMKMSGLAEKVKTTAIKQPHSAAGAPKPDKDYPHKSHHEANHLGGKGETASSQPVPGHAGNHMPTQGEGRHVGMGEHHTHTGAAEPHRFAPAPAGAHGFGHSVAARSYAERSSGHPGAHRIGKKG